MPNWYLDLTMIIKYWEGASRVYHHTAPINMLYGLYQALRCVIEEGLDHVFQRHRHAHEQLVAGLAEMGIDMLVDAAIPLADAQCGPDPGGRRGSGGAQDAAGQSTTSRSARLGPLAGRIWRIGLMGHTARPENVARVLDALRAALQEQRSAT